MVFLVIGNTFFVIVIYKKNCPDVISYVIFVLCITAHLYTNRFCLLLANILHSIYILIGKIINLCKCIVIMPLL